MQVILDSINNSSSSSLSPGKNRRKTTGLIWQSDMEATPQRGNTSSIFAYTLCSTQQNSTVHHTRAARKMKRNEPLWLLTKNTLALKSCVPRPVSKKPFKVTVLWTPSRIDNAICSQKLCHARHSNAALVNLSKPRSTERERFTVRCRWTAHGIGEATAKRNSRSQIAPGAGTLRHSEESQKKQRSGTLAYCLIRSDATIIRISRVFWFIASYSLNLTCWHRLRPARIYPLG